MSAGRLLWVPLLVMGLVVVGCRAEQTEEGEVPDVRVEGGELPEYDVEAAGVDVTTDTQVIETPEVEVTPP